MAKRLLDIVVALIALAIFGPVILTALFLVWRQDGHSPLYRASRVGLNGQDFTMIKIRSMTINADKTGVSSTSATDDRVTPVGRVVRRFKLDELMQFWNVLRGDMSVVGPRPNTRAWGVDLYTQEERKLLKLKPGVTDLSSIVFSDEGEILTGAAHADLHYNRIIRPWKSRLGLLYLAHMSVWLDLELIMLTAAAIISRRYALTGVERVLRRLGADPDLIKICRRDSPLPVGAPPGASEPVSEALAS